MENILPNKFCIIGELGRKFQDFLPRKKVFLLKMSLIEEKLVTYVGGVSSSKIVVHIMIEKFVIFE